MSINNGCPCTEISTLQHFPASTLLLLYRSGFAVPHCPCFRNLHSPPAEATIDDYLFVFNYNYGKLYIFMWLSDILLYHSHWP